jgi:hypothetical protein
MAVLADELGCRAATGRLEDQTPITLTAAQGLEYIRYVARIILKKYVTISHTSLLQSKAPISYFSSVRYVQFSYKPSLHRYRHVLSFMTQEICSTCLKMRLEQQSRFGNQLKDILDVSRCWISVKKRYIHTVKGRSGAVGIHTLKNTPSRFVLEAERSKNCPRANVVTQTKIKVHRMVKLGHRDRGIALGAKSQNRWCFQTGSI